ncbi:MAG: LegC family aminotransferase [Sulfurimonas sp.]|nr:MAG: LegC family aminotransferase [Sulfurimonas sp.]
MFDTTVAFIRKAFDTTAYIPLHEPHFAGNEKQYLNDCIDSTFVSSVGTFVDRFEQQMASYTGAEYAIATVNGTAALHISLLLANVQPGDEVITQPLTFVATCNAISYCHATPVFVDVDSDTMGLSPQALKAFLQTHCVVENFTCKNRTSNKVIRACVPMHTFGHPCRIDEIKALCDAYHIALVEDAAESLGSTYKGRHTGTFGMLGAVSFNGNKIITGGGGGCILTNDATLAAKAKHISTTAKVPHQWEYTHDSVGYNYRMPNLNAALLVAQLERLDEYVENKRCLAREYEMFFTKSGMRFVTEPLNSRSNYWLNALILPDKAARDRFLEATNAKGVMTRPVWTLMHKLPMFQEAPCAPLKHATWLESRVVNIPSSVRLP